MDYPPHTRGVLDRKVSIMQLQTDRLILRTPRPEDAEHYTAIHNSEFVLRFNAMQPTTKERMEKAIQDPEYAKTALYLEEKASGNVIGAIFLEEDSLRYGVASMGLSYMMAESYARKGFMKEAMQAVLRHLFEMEHLECVSARVFAPNTASRALLRSLGFRENGIIPRCVKGYGNIVFDDVIHTLLQEDFQKE